MTSMLKNSQWVNNLTNGGEISCTLLYEWKNIFYFNFSPQMIINIKLPTLLNSTWKKFKFKKINTEKSRKGHITLKMEESTRQHKQKYFNLLLKSYIMLYKQSLPNSSNRVFRLNYSRFMLNVNIFRIQLFWYI